MIRNRRSQAHRTPLSHIADRPAKRLSVFFTVTLLLLPTFLSAEPSFPLSIGKWAAPQTIRIDYILEEVEIGEVIQTPLLIQGKDRFVWESFHDWDIITDSKSKNPHFSLHLKSAAHPVEMGIAAFDAKAWPVFKESEASLKRYAAALKTNSPEIALSSAALITPEQTPYSTDDKTFWEIKCDYNFEEEPNAQMQIIFRMENRVFVFAIAGPEDSVNQLSEAARKQAIFFTPFNALGG